MPLQDPSTFHKDHVEFWKARARAGHSLTAFAVSVLDMQTPAVEKSGADADYACKGQMLLTHYLLDGHHRLQPPGFTFSELGSRWYQGLQAVHCQGRQFSAPSLSN